MSSQEDSNLHTISLTEVLVFAFLTGSIMNVLISIKDLIDTGITTGLVVSWIISALLILFCILWLVFLIRKGKLKTDQMFRPRGMEI